MSQTYYVRTQYDGRDYRSVEEIYYYDEDGEEQVDIDLTSYCIGITTCADQGEDTWSFIKDQVELRLKAKNISFEMVVCHQDAE